MSSPRAVWLIGMPSSGKTTLCRQMHGTDTDDVLGLQTAFQECKTPDEFYDRECEAVVNYVQSNPKGVVATGGSVVHREEAMEAIARSGAIVVFLDAPLRRSKGETRGLVFQGNRLTRRHRKLGRPLRVSTPVVREVGESYPGHVCLFVGVVRADHRVAIWMNQHDGEENGPNERVSLPKKKNAQGTSKYAPFFVFVQEGVAR